MKKLFLLIVVLMFSVVANAQIETPTKWSYAAKRTSPTEAVIFLKATIQTGWHIYSQKIKPGGPIKTSFKFSPSKSYILVGKTVEPSPKIKYEKSFKMNIGYFENEVIFQQKLKLKTTGPISIKGSLEYAVCNNIGCLPSEVIAFNVPVK